MKLVSITAVYGDNRSYVAVAADFDEAVRRINSKLRRAYDREVALPSGWIDVPVPNTTSVIRSTPLGTVVFRVDDHDVP